MTHSLITLVSTSETQSLWMHPQLDLYGLANRKDPKPSLPVQRAKLYLVPSTFGEEFEEDDFPIPTSSSDLPDIQEWGMKFAVSTVEIWAGRRNPAQMMSWCHKEIYTQLLRKVGSQREIGRIRTLHQNQPLDGICETTATVRYKDRLRSIAIRFEGVNGRWLCTNLDLI